MASADQTDKFKRNTSAVYQRIGIDLKVEENYWLIKSVKNSVGMLL